MIPVYLSICKQLAEKLPLMAHIDLFNNQYDSASKEHPFNMPAVFVQFMPLVDFVTNADGSQSATVKIQFHFVTTCYSDAANAHRFDEVARQMAFKHLQFAGEAHKVLHHFAPDCCTNLQRSAHFYDTDFDQIQVTICEYTCQFYDNTTADSVIK